MRAQGRRWHRTDSRCLSLVLLALVVPVLLVSASAARADSLGTFTNTGAMATAREGHSATLLPSGKLLVAGGCVSGGYTSSAEAYDAASGLVGAAGTLTVARDGHAATLLPSGKILIVGGYNYFPSMPTAEVYDPATGLSSVTGSMATARAAHSATLLPSGKVLVTGGGESGEESSFAIATAEVYDPATGV